MGNVLTSINKSGATLFSNKPATSETPPFVARSPFMFAMSTAMAKARATPVVQTTNGKGNKAKQPQPQPNAAEKKEGKVGKHANPGSVDELHKNARDLQPQPFGGGKVIWNKCLSNHFQISHILHMGSKPDRGYRFGATYVGTKEFSPTDCYPVLMGEIDPAGNFSANIIHKMTERLRWKFSTQLQDTKPTVTQLISHYNGDDFTASLVVNNPSVMKMTTEVVVHYLKAVSSRLAVGCELNYRLDGKVPSKQCTAMTAALRYCSGNSIWAGTFNKRGMHVSYYQRANDRLQMGVELDTNFWTRESLATLAYQADLPRSNTIFRASIDSNWNVCGVMEKRLDPLPFSFALSGHINHEKDKFRLGCALTIG